MSDMPRVIEAAKPSGSWGQGKLNIINNVKTNDPADARFNTQNATQQTTLDKNTPTNESGYDTLQQQQQQQTKQQNNNNKNKQRNSKNRQNNNKNVQSDDVATTADNGSTNNDVEPKREKKVYDTPYQPIDKQDQPDETKYKSNKAELEKQIESNKNKINDITGKIDVLSANRTAQRSEKQPLLEQIKKLREEKNSLFNQANEYIAKIDNAKAQDATQRKRLNELKKQLEFTSLDELDSYVRHVENTLSTSSVPVNQERQLIEKIRKLKQQRDLIVEYNNEVNNVGDRIDTTQWEHERRKLQKSAGQIKQQLDELQKQLDSMDNVGGNVNTELDKLIQKRNELRETNKQLIEQSKQLDRDFKQQQYMYDRWVKQEAYEEQKRKRESERLKKQQDYEERQRKRLERERINKEREEQREQERLARLEWEEEQARIQEEEEAKRDVWEVEKYVCDELIKYLYSIAPKDIQQQYKNENDDNNNDKTSSTVDKLELAKERANEFKTDDNKPLVAIKSNKKNKFGDSLFGDAVQNNKQQQNQKQIQKQQTNKTSTTINKSKTNSTSVLSHKPEIFLWFQQIDINPPHTQPAVPNVIQQVKDKRIWYENAPRELKTGKKHSNNNNNNNNNNNTGNVTDNNTTANANANANANATVNATVNATATVVVSTDKLTNPHISDVKNVINVINDQDGPLHQHTNNSGDISVESNQLYGRAGAGDQLSLEDNEHIHARVEAKQEGKNLDPFDDIQH